MHTNHPRPGFERVYPCVYVCTHNVFASFQVRDLEENSGPASTFDGCVVCWMDATTPQCTTTKTLDCGHWFETFRSITQNPTPHETLNPSLDKVEPLLAFEKTTPYNNTHRYCHRHTEALATKVTTHVCAPIHFTPRLSKLRIEASGSIASGTDTGTKRLGLVSCACTLSSPQQRQQQTSHATGTVSAV